MKLRTSALAFCLSLFALVAAVPALAADGAPGAGQQGLSLLAAYDGSYLYYVERGSPGSNIMDKDYGWMNGGFAEIRYDFPAAFVRLRGDASATDSATYDGALQNGTPYRSATSERTWKAEIDAGYKVYDRDRLTVAPYLGVGYRDWLRGKDVLPDYQEDYHWWYAALGLNMAYRVDRWLLGFDFAVFCPFSMRMETNVAGQYDKAKFDIQPRPGLRAELPVGYEVAAGQAGKLAVFLIPYYEKWEIGKSHHVTLSQGGVPVGAAYEPKSSTDVMGVRLGLGVSF